MKNKVIELNTTPKYNPQARSYAEVLSYILRRRMGLQSPGAIIMMPETVDQQALISEIIRRSGNSYNFQDFSAPADIDTASLNEKDEATIFYNYSPATGQPEIDQQNTIRTWQVSRVEPRRQAIVLAKGIPDKKVTAGDYPFSYEPIQEVIRITEEKGQIRVQTLARESSSTFWKKESFVNDTVYSFKFSTFHDLPNQLPELVNLGYKHDQILTSLASEFPHLHNQLSTIMDPENLHLPPYGRNRTAFNEHSATTLSTALMNLIDLYPEMDIAEKNFNVILKTAYEMDVRSRENISSIVEQVNSYTEEEFGYQMQEIELQKQLYEKRPLRYGGQVRMGYKRQGMIDFLKEFGFDIERLGLILPSSDGLGDSYSTAFAATIGEALLTMTKMHIRGQIQADNINDQFGRLAGFNEYRQDG